MKYDGQLFYMHTALLSGNALFIPGRNGKCNSAGDNSVMFNLQGGEVFQATNGSCNYYAPARATLCPQCVGIYDHISVL